YNNNKENKPKNILNNTYGYDFNKWFSDRFRKREKLLNVKQKILNKFAISRYTIDGIVPNMGIKYLSNDYYNSFSGIFALNKNDIQEINEQMQKFYDFCNKNRIKCYIMVSPKKSSFIPGEMNFFKTKDNIGELNKHLKYKIINPYNYLKKAQQKETVFYYVDDHLSQFGKYTVTKVLLDVIRKDIPDLPDIDENDYKITFTKQENKNLVYSKKYLDKLYKRFEDIKGKQPIVEQSLVDKYKKIYMYDKRKEKICNDANVFEDGYNKKTIWIGSSYVGHPAPIFTYSIFKNSLVFKNCLGGIKVYKDIVEEYKPDIIVIHIDYQRIKELRYFMEE
ncbi:MAG: hypothetical protein LBT02_02275, partial [Rickettsiales bacterium]|nr:hypothetical protein [Rickettsiales bacterium]